MKRKPTQPNSGEERLKLQLDSVLSNIADDLEKINKGETEELRILGLPDNLYRRINELLKLPAEFAQKLNTPKQPASDPVLKKPNIQDTVLKKVK